MLRRCCRQPATSEGEEKCMCRHCKIRWKFRQQGNAVPFPRSPVVSWQCKNIHGRMEAAYGIYI